MKEERKTHRAVWSGGPRRAERGPPFWSAAIHRRFRWALGRNGVCASRDARRHGVSPHSMRRPRPTLPNYAANLADNLEKIIDKLVPVCVAPRATSFAASGSPNVVIAAKIASSTPAGSRASRRLAAAALLLLPAVPYAVEPVPNASRARRSRQVHVAVAGGVAVLRRHSGRASQLDPRMLSRSDRPSRPGRVAGEDGESELELRAPATPLPDGNSLLPSCRRNSWDSSIRRPAACPRV